MSSTVVIIYVKCKVYFLCSEYTCELVSSMNYGCAKSYLYIPLPYPTPAPDPTPTKLVSSGAHKSSRLFTIGNH